MINQQDVEQAVKRMQSVWPRVQTTPGLKAEMVAAVMRHAGKLEPADLAAGVDSLIESRPADPANVEVNPHANGPALVVAV